MNYLLNTNSLGGIFYITANVLQLTEVGDYEAQNLNIK
jgi:hypothetical protein